jgi:hypothetical protein
MSTGIDVQEHFSLMGECLDPEVSETEQIDALLNHASEELNLVVKFQSRTIFQLAGASVKRAHLLNDLCTGIQSAFSRLSIAWEFEERGRNSPLPNTSNI